MGISDFDEQNLCFNYLSIYYGYIQERESKNG